ncbi:MAG TPA: DUF2092 domain-containing protein [Geminicoccaceae bacterium]|nr:DUF2092 domain-containing protein [Geminicoccaceae bacterium]
METVMMHVTGARSLGLALAVALVLLPLGAARGQSSPSVPPQQIETTLPASGADIEPEADRILRQMTDHLAGLKTFAVTADAATEVLLRDGRKIQLTATGRAVVDRKLGFRVERRGPNGLVRVTYDGTRVSLLAEAPNAYATIEAAGGNDVALDELRAVLGTEAAGGVDLLYAQPYEGLLLEVESGEYLGLTWVGGVPAHQLSFRAAEIDWQLWVRAEGDPVPVKYVITSKWLAGAPQFSVQLSDWDTGASLSAADLAFTPPAGARALDAAELYELAAGE